MKNWADYVDGEKLLAWMDRQGLESGPMLNAKALAGGTQNLLLKFSRGDRTFVFRRPPQHLRKNSNEAMRREARVLAALADTNVPHPRLIAACPDEDVLGASFYLMEMVDGFNLSNGMPQLHASDPALRHRMGLSLIEAIAALGNVDYRAVGLEGYGKPDGFLERQAPQWLKHYTSYEKFEGYPGHSSIPGVDDVADWLEANRPETFTPGIMHGDFHIANLMFRNDSPELAAIVDWELSTIGDPLLDLGWMIATWPDKKGRGIVTIDPWAGFPAPEELAAHYAERSTRNIDKLDWYVVLACFKLGIVIEGTHARACAGKAPKQMGDYLHGAALMLFGRAQRRIAGIS